MNIQCITLINPFPTRDGERVIPLSFQIPITDSVPTTLRLFAEVRNSIEYPYHDLHLFISQNLQDSTVWRTDTITFCLADSTGRWTGHGWGSIYQSETFITSVRPLHPANYTIKIMSGMKDEKLQGLSDVGIQYWEAVRLESSATSCINAQEDKQQYRKSP